MGKIRLVYTCSYDGNVCDKATPKVDDEGYFIPESNKELFEKYSKVIADHVLEEGWDICENCPRNYSMGKPHGVLKCEGCTIEKA